MTKDEYKCVSCALYDQLEGLATYNKKVQLRYKDENGNIQVKATAFKNFKTINKEEFVILADDSLLRLDKILQIEEL